MSITLVTAGPNDNIYWKHNQVYYYGLTLLPDNNISYHNAVVASLKQEQLEDFPCNQAFLVFFDDGWLLTSNDYQLISNEITGSFDIYYKITLPDINTMTPLLKGPCTNFNVDQYSRRQVPQVDLDISIGTDNNVYIFFKGVRYRFNRPEDYYRKTRSTADMIGSITLNQEIYNLINDSFGISWNDTGIVLITWRETGTEVIAQTNDWNSHDGDFDSLTVYPPKREAIKLCLDYDVIQCDKFPPNNQRTALIKYVINQRKIRQKFNHMKNELKETKDLLDAATSKLQGKILPLPNKIILEGQETPIISYDQASVLLKNKKIIKYYLDPYLQAYVTDPNKLITLYTNEGLGYLVIAQYNNENIFPPIL